MNGLVNCTEVGARGICMFSNYVQKFDFSDEDLSSKAQVIFYEYWLSLSKDGRLPNRQDFDPMKIPAALPHIIMEDVLYEPLRFKIRLIGSKCRVPNSYLGKFINDVPEMKRVSKMLKRSVEARKPYFYFNDLTLDRSFVKVYSSLVLPFSQDGENVNIIMACHSQVD